MENLGSRDANVELALRLIIDQPDFPAVFERIREVMNISRDDDSCLSRLTNVILRDYGLTCKLLRTVNSASFSRSGRQISSVAHAVTMLGVDAIRDLASSLTFFGHFSQTMPGLREVMLLSLMTANNAREIAARSGYPRPEEAYLCGMFRNLGEVLVAKYFTLEYAQILRYIRDLRLSERGASLEVLHFTYDDLGKRVLTHWQLPEQMSAAMSGPVKYAPAPKQEEAVQLHALVSFSHSLTTTLYRVNPEDSAAGLKHLVAEFRQVLPFKLEEVQKIAHASVDETQDTFAALRVPLNALQLREQTARVLKQVAGTNVEAVLGGVEIPHRESLLRQLVEEMNSRLNGARDFDHNGLLLMALEAIERGIPCDRVLFGFLDNERGEIVGRFGLGEEIEELLARFHFPLAEESGPVSAALAGDADVLRDDNQPEDCIETECAKVLGAPWFGLYPVVIEQLHVGCLYFERRVPRAPLRAAERALLDQLRGHVAAIVERKHARAASVPER